MLRLSIASTFFLLFCLGCTEKYRHAEMVQAVSQRQSLPHLVVQFCTPANLENDRLLTEEIGHWESARHLVSNVLKQSGLTSNLIPVFESHGDALGDTELFTVSFNAIPHCYVFIPPRSVPSEDWSSWVQPDFEVDLNAHHTAFQLVNNGKVVKLQPSSNAPRARYRMMYLKNFFPRISNRRINGLDKNITPP